MNPFNRRDYFMLLLALLVGILGMGLFQVSWHLYNDHLLVDVIRAQFQQQAQQQAKPAEQKPEAK